MPVAMLLEIPGGTQEDYDRVMDELQLEGMPDGGILHIAAPMDGGWRVLDVWETQEHFERFYEIGWPRRSRSRAWPRPTRRSSRRAAA